MPESLPEVHYEPSGTTPSIRGSFMAISSPYYINPQTLATITEIIKRESGGDPTVCNVDYGCSAGMGLTQLIPSTVLYCEEKLGRIIDPFNSKDNVACAVWLLENEGIIHWDPYSGPY